MKQVKYPFLCVLLFIFLSISSGFISLNGAEAKILTKNLYQKISLSSSKGEISLYAPDKYAAGDTISGKLMAEPSGKTGKIQAKNAKLLDQYSVEVAGVKTGIGNGWATWTVPDAKDFTVTLLNEKGKRVDSIQIPVHDEGLGKKTQDFQCPKILQAGHAFPIMGQYNGVSDDTFVRVGDEELQKLAESPRVIVVEPPPQQTGEMEITVTEGNVTKTFKTRNISVLLHADDLHLKRGQTTNFTVTVKGLEELEERLPLFVTNHSRETVNLEGEGTVWIEPSAVNSEDGSFVFESSILAYSSGSFRITATVIDEFAFAPPIESADLGEADNGEVRDDGEKKPKDDKEQEEVKEQEGEQEGDEGEKEDEEKSQEGDEKENEEQEGEKKEEPKKTVKELEEENRKLEEENKRLKEENKKLKEKQGDEGENKPEETKEQKGEEKKDEEKGKDQSGENEDEERVPKPEIITEQDLKEFDERLRKQAMEHMRQQNKFLNLVLKLEELELRIEKLEKAFLKYGEKDEDKNGDKGKKGTTDNRKSK